MPWFLLWMNLVKCTTSMPEICDCCHKNILFEKRVRSNIWPKKMVKFLVPSSPHFLYMSSYSHQLGPPFPTSLLRKCKTHFSLPCLLCESYAPSLECLFSMHGKPWEWQFTCIMESLFLPSPLVPSWISPRADWS